MQAVLKDTTEETEADGWGNVLIMAHGISILSMLSDMTEDVPSNGAIQNASVTKIIYKDGKFTVNSVASTEYLEVGEK